MVVCRGVYRRSHAMLVRALERAGSNVVAARAWSHAGEEFSRLLSLWLFLIFREAQWPRWLAWMLEFKVGLSEESFDDVEKFGVVLACRRSAVFDPRIAIAKIE